jgi:acetyl-CoA synthetase
MDRAGARIVGGVTDIIWSPTDEYVERANVTRFMRAHGIETAEELVARSVADVSWFWDAVVRDVDIEFLQPYEQVLDVSRGVEWATWFGGGRVNLAHQCVDRWSVSTPDAPAVVWEGEDGEVRTWTYADLRRETDRLSRALRRLGVEAGEAVGIFLPMLPETVAAVMACSKIGAVWVPIFSGFGPDAIAVRLADAGVKVMLTADAFLRKGRDVSMAETARGALARGD